MYSYSYRMFFYESSFVYVIAVIGLIVSMLAITCSNYGRKVPENYGLLFLFTICEGYCISFVGFYDKKIVLTAFILTIMMTLALTLYAFKTDKDITL